MKSTRFLALMALTMGITFNINHASARSPSVNPLVEIDIETDQRPKEATEGFDFSNTQKNTKRVPANITVNHQNTEPTSYIGPILFLLAMPLGIWLMVSKRFSKKVVESQTHDNVRELKKDHDDFNFPKAS